jgi:hypothetical protein
MGTISMFFFIRRDDDEKIRSAGTPKNEKHNKFPIDSPINIGYFPMCIPKKIIPYIISHNYIPSGYLT